jgi:hypothetical protein
MRQAFSRVPAGLDTNGDRIAHKKVRGCRKSMTILQHDAIVCDCDAMRQFRELWARSTRDRESAAWIIRVTAPRVGYKLIRWQSGGSTHAAWSGSAPSGLAGQVHTHPMGLDPKPSTSDSRGGQGDWGVAIKTKQPVYVLSIWAIWKVMPDATKADRIQLVKDWLDP